MQKFTNPLDHVKIAAPCRADWNKMTGGDRVRFCAECKLNVYNLSAMTRDEAESLLINTEGRLCVRFYRRKDGTILTKNCPVGFRAIKRRIERVATAALAAVIAFCAGIDLNRVFSFKNPETAWEKDVPPVEIEKESAPVLGQAEFAEVGQVEVTNESFVLGSMAPVPMAKLEEWKKNQSKRTFKQIRKRVLQEK